MIAMTKTPIGIMQGRLSPPEDGRFQSFQRRSWREEFPRAREASFDYIEWIHDEYGRTANPIFSQADLAEFDVLKRQYGIAAPGTCAVTGSWTCR
jgi:L-ribulose-5-phosphate 3-epimerase